MDKNINDVKNRFLPIPESVVQGLYPEPKITDFTIIKELGAGSFGHLYLVTNKKTKVNYAIKAIDKRNKSNIEEKPYFCHEVEVMYKFIIQIQSNYMEILNIIIIALLLWNTFLKEICLALLLKIKRKELVHN